MFMGEGTEPEHREINHSVPLLSFFFFPFWTLCLTLLINAMRLSNACKETLNNETVKEKLRPDYNPIWPQ